MDDPESRPAPELLRVPIEAFTVADYATVDLWLADPKILAVDAFRVMREHGFDVAPVADEPVSRYVTFDDSPPPDLSVEAVARPINVADVVSNTSSLAGSVERLLASPHLFVISGKRGVEGLVVQADLQRPAVAMVALSLVLAAEAAFTQLIVETYGREGWQASIGRGRVEKAGVVLEARRRYNVDLDLLDCLMLDDRLTLVQKSDHLVGQLSYESKGECKQAFKRISDARDVLAHAGNLLSTCSSPVEAIKLFVDIRRLAEHSWSLVKDVPRSWTARPANY